LEIEGLLDQKPSCCSEFLTCPPNRPSNRSGPHPLKILTIESGEQTKLVRDGQPGTELRVRGQVKIALAGGYSASQTLVYLTCPLDNSGKITDLVFSTIILVLDLSIFVEAEGQVRDRGLSRTKTLPAAAKFRPFPPNRSSNRSGPRHS
jgi:hypothetical protein